jgi:hypothetical protein
MARIAIDVVLLPSPEMMDFAIAINKELLKTNEKKIVLDKINCLPHISLCMGCIDEKDLPAISEVLKCIAAEHKTFALTAKCLVAETIPTGKKTSYIAIEHDDELVRLHQSIMERLWKYLSYDVTTEMLFNPSEVEEVSLYWIRNYKKKKDKPASFDAHITTGFGVTKKFTFPVSFTAPTLALCQLGNYCTARKVLAAADLQPCPHSS